MFMDAPAQPHPLQPWTKLVGLNEANANARANANPNNYLPQSMPKGECQLNTPSLSAYGNTKVPYQGYTCGQVTEPMPDQDQREPKELFHNHGPLLGYPHNTGLSPVPRQCSALGLGSVTSLGLGQSPEPAISSSHGLEQGPKPGNDSILTTSTASLSIHGQNQGIGDSNGQGNCNCYSNGYSHSHENSTNEVPVPAQAQAPVPAPAHASVHDYVHRIELMHGNSRDQLFSHLSSDERYQLFIELYKSHGRMAAIGLAPVALKVSKVS